MTETGRVPTIALIAGEISGDLLGAAITRALRTQIADVRVIGVAGPRMVEAGCEAIASIDTLSVMGLAEVLPAIPRLLKLRRFLINTLEHEKPDVVIGIDAPDFNLGLERRLRNKGLHTAHVVSPSIWAWRAGRVKGICESAETMLCLLPFEPEHYAGHPIDARYIGHPLADELDEHVTPQQARAQLGLPIEGRVVAILPGSRGSELKYLASTFAQTASLLSQRFHDVRFVTPIAKPSLEPALRAAIEEHAPNCQWDVVAGQSRLAMQAADTVLLASGTATLECLLLGRSMTVAYKGSALTAWLMLRMGLLKTAHVSLPNLLSEQPCVTELLQDKATPENLAQDIGRLLESDMERDKQLSQFTAVRHELRRDAAVQTANVIVEKYLRQ